MAIVKMNKFTLLAFESEKEKLLKKIQSSSEVEFINLQDEEKVEGNEVFESLSKDDLDAETTLIEENVSKTRSALDFLKEFVAEVGGLKALKAGKESLTLDELEVKVENSNWEVVYSEVKKMERELATLENEKTKLLGEIEILEPWQSFDAPLGELNNFEKVVAFLGVISSQNLENMKNEIESEFKESYIEVISNTDQDSYVFVMTMKERAEEMDEVLKNFGFSAFQTKYKEKASVLVEEFKLKIKEIISRGKLPIIVGGTGFYIQTILYDIEFAKSDENDGIRDELNKLYEEHGAAFLHDMLAKVDPEYAAEVHENNVKKVIRAIEFYRQTGHKLSEHNTEQRERTSP